MSRLVRAPDPAAATGRGADNYLERVAKYVPAEVIAFFIFINAILDQAMRSGGPDATMSAFPVTAVATCALLVALVLTPLFIWYVREDGDAWVTNAVVATIAFPFWAYALGAVAFADYRDGNLAAILLATFTVISGLVAPRPSRRDAVAAEAAPPVTASPAVRERPHFDLVETNRL